MININDLSVEDTYSTALMLLFIFSKNDRYSTLSELAYILDHDNFMKFIKYYEGQTITIPSQEEITKSLRVLMLYQYYVIEQRGWKESLTKSGFSEDETYTAQRLLTSFKKSVEDYKIGDMFNGGKY